MFGEGIRVRGGQRAVSGWMLSERFTAALESEKAPDIERSGGAAGKKRGKKNDKGRRVSKGWFQKFRVAVKGAGKMAKMELVNKKSRSKGKKG